MINTVPQLTTIAKKPEGADGKDQLTLYYSDFEMNVNEWIKNYNNICELKQTIMKKLGDQWVSMFKASTKICTAFMPVKLHFICPIDIIGECFFLETEMSTSATQFLDIVKLKLKANHYDIVENTIYVKCVEEYFLIACKAYESLKSKLAEEKTYLKCTKEISDKLVHLKNFLPGFALLHNRIITPMITVTKRVYEIMRPERERLKHEIRQICDNVVSKFKDFTSPLLSPPLKKKCTELIKVTNEIDAKTLEKLSISVDEELDKKKVLYHKIIQDLAVVILQINKPLINASDYTVYKPATEVYNLLMRIIFYLGIQNAAHTGLPELISFTRKKLRGLWKDELTKPCSKFYEIALSEIKRAVNEPDFNESISIYKIFEKIKLNMLNLWNSQIIEKSRLFTSFKLSD